MTTQIVFLAIAIFVLLLCLVFVCIRGAQLEYRIEVLETELRTLKESSNLMSQKIDFLLLI